MSWSTTDPAEPKTFYRSKADDVPSIEHDLNLVFQRMLKNKKVDGAATAEGLLIIFNATNGYIKVVWCDVEKDKLPGEWAYWLELKSLWKKAEEQGAFYFDRTCYLAVSGFMESMIYDDRGNAAFRVFTRTEITEAEELRL